MCEVTFKQRQKIVTEEMEALDKVVEKIGGLKKAYSDNEEAEDAIEQCLEIIDQHIEERAGNC